jgi:hypothetical protein
MATENRVLDLSFVAAESLASDQYRIMILDPTTGKVRRPDHATTAAEAAVVRVMGITKIVFGETVAVGEYVKLEYNDAADAGKALDADGALDVVLGMCVKGGAEDDLGEVLLPGATWQVGAAS